MGHASPRDCKALEKETDPAEYYFSNEKMQVKLKGMKVEDNSREIRDKENTEDKIKKTRSHLMMRSGRKVKT